MSVRNTSAPPARNTSMTCGLGCPYLLPVPTLTSATRGRTALRNAGSEYRDPWCGTLSTSALRSRSPSNAAWPASSTSPVSNTRPALVCALSTSE